MSGCSNKQSSVCQRHHVYPFQEVGLLGFNTDKKLHTSPLNLVLGEKANADLDVGSLWLYVACMTCEVSLCLRQAGEEDDSSQPSAVPALRCLCVSDSEGGVKERLRYVQFLSLSLSHYSQRACSSH